ncbi:hypothetical protein [Leyella stercorea]|uniref:hypothetical protein n=1 Tax=Leyella stercorea TaxID=363265 RepID=UPI00242E98A6|nr:hypothetical protein [Leyella stercorea]
MKKEYIKPKIIIIKTYNDDALLQSASLYDYDKVDPDENIAGEGGEPDTGDDGFIWND